MAYVSAFLNVVDELLDDLLGIPFVVVVAAAALEATVVSTDWWLSCWMAALEQALGASSARAVASLSVNLARVLWRSCCHQ